MKEFAERLKELREEKGLTYSALAQQINVSAVAISRWERMLRTPSIEQLKNLAIFFNVSSDYLIGLEDYQ